MLYQMLWSYALLNMVGVYIAFGLFVLIACQVEASEQQDIIESLPSHSEEDVAETA
ncbi:MAG: hypothetical protein AB7T49_04810 [Oligoflexales bacterium]